MILKGVTEDLTFNDLNQQGMHLERMAYYEKGGNTTIF